MPEEQQQTKVEEERPEKEKPGLLGFTFRQLGAIAGACAFLNALHHVVDWLNTFRDAVEYLKFLQEFKWQHNILLALDAFRSFTRPIATLLFGWIPALLHWPFPGWAKDYLTVGAIVTSATIRTVFYRQLAGYLIDRAIMATMDGPCYRRNGFGASAQRQ
jgi:hypothetical protein